VVENKLGTLGKGFGKKKEKGMVAFQGYTKNKT